MSCLENAYSLETIGLFPLNSSWPPKNLSSCSPVLFTSKSRDAQEASVRWNLCEADINGRLCITLTECVSLSCLLDSEQCFVTCSCVKVSTVGRKWSRADFWARRSLRPVYDVCCHLTNRWVESTWLSRCFFRRFVYLIANVAHYLSVVVEIECFSSSFLATGRCSLGRVHRNCFLFSELLILRCQIGVGQKAVINQILREARRKLNLGLL